MWPRVYQVGLPVVFIPIGGQWRRFSLRLNCQLSGISVEVLERLFYLMVLLCFFPECASVHAAVMWQPVVCLCSFHGGPLAALPAFGRGACGRPLAPFLVSRFLTASPDTQLVRRSVNNSISLVGMSILKVAPVSFRAPSTLPR